MSCSCGSPYVVNKHFNKCNRCNNKRLEALKSPSTVKRIKRKKKFTVLKEKAIKTILADEAFYEECFNRSDHRCEECDCQLPEDFRDDNGKVLMKSRYSHILPKSTHSEHRHSIININNLCLTHHTQWETGDAKSMKIWQKNKKTIKILLWLSKRFLSL